MRKIAFLLTSVVVFYSCKKDQLSQLRSQFSGTWEFEKSIGAFANTGLPPGNGNIILLGTDGSFERRKHDTIIFKGVYFLEERKDCYGDEKKIFFKTSDSSYTADVSIETGANTLTMNTSDCYADGGATIYRKK